MVPTIPGFIELGVEVDTADGNNSSIDGVYILLFLLSSFFDVSLNLEDGFRAQKTPKSFNFDEKQGKLEKFAVWKAFLGITKPSKKVSFHSDDKK